jgi:hypothetical protein
MTNGPYCATGSPIGRPCSSRISNRPAVRLDGDGLIRLHLDRRRAGNVLVRHRQTLAGELMQRAHGSRIARRRQRPHAPVLHGDRPDGEVGFRVRAPRMRRRRQRLTSPKRSGDHRHRRVFLPSLRLKRRVECDRSRTS